MVNSNPLYPAFFRLDRLQMLVVGAGAVGEEKLKFILKSSPNARVTIVAPWMGEALKSLLDTYQQEADLSSPSQDQAGAQVQSKVVNAAGHWQTAAGGYVTWYDREFRDEDVDTADLVVAATDFKDVNLSVWKAAKAARRLTNIADTPELCDFYLGSIVTRGPLKVAISTNGQSPTFAKRFRQFLEAELPEMETATLLDNLKIFRDRLSGDFQMKVRELSTLTSGLLASGTAAPRRCPAGSCLLASATTPTAEEGAPENKA